MMGNVQLEIKNAMLSCPRFAYNVQAGNAESKSQPFVSTIARARCWQGTPAICGGNWPWRYGLSTAMGDVEAKQPFANLFTLNKRKPATA